MKSKLALITLAAALLAMPLPSGAASITRLPGQTSAAYGGATHKLTLTAADIAAATNAATQAVVTNQVYPITGLFGSNTVASLVFLDLVIPFSANTGDTNVNTNHQIWLGDRLSTNRFGLAGANVATNAGLGAGSPRVATLATNGPVVAYTNANSLQLISSVYLVTNATATNLTAGQLDLYLRVFDKAGLRGN